MNNKSINYLLYVLCIVAILFIVRPVIIPCCTAFMIAYLLNPLVNKLEFIKLPRALSAFIIITTSISIMIIFLIIFIPIICSQTIELIKFFVEKMPLSNTHNLQSIIKTYNFLDNNDITKIIQLLTNSHQDLLNNGNIKPLITIFGNLLQNFNSILSYTIHSGINISYIIVMIFVVLLLTFYILCNWPFIIKNFYNLTPVIHKENIESFIRKVDNIIASYIRGQISVCCIMFIYYYICFVILDTKYSLVMGLISGIMTFIPYFGSSVCAIISICINIFHTNNWITSGIILCIFIIGQCIESNIITPLLIGKKIDLHPIWLIIGMIICHTYIGFIGVLLSIPITAIVGVFVQSIIQRYIKSDFHNGI
ncbi:AI-2E family transporter [Neoehrlichia mikurensis]|uniref:AI-2E family transporter n=1 Tax=Neoehrlichia mikurensis TaxID=89586 RepID=A0A9Q9BZM2_9RICK|nr:AI-2E family transporter [Neoehrlichia mikurensis]QXK92142.1 AI-2E family transporter [Neoehrlichia mikurensis]QXK92599.1 AI-2E family transporter [Neoehrlichia mikurensis]QXK93836.1 AI-2E family transporter [Neoehrlichia mikurensis]UTO55169.1 AI-2E family transporter [Neoehrlichia mikurensis]UTO56089.1 AI-2E family transporter [Neoehrlichia mikurensis]